MLGLTRKPPFGGLALITSKNSMRAVKRKEQLVIIPSYTAYGYIVNSELPGKISPMVQ